MENDRKRRSRFNEIYFLSFSFFFERRLPFYRCLLRYKKYRPSVSYKIMENRLKITQSFSPFRHSVSSVLHHRISLVESIREVVSPIASHGSTGSRGVGKRITTGPHLVPYHRSDDIKFRDSNRERSDSSISIRATPMQFNLSRGYFAFRVGYVSACTDTRSHVRVHGITRSDVFLLLSYSN